MDDLKDVYSTFLSPAGLENCLNFVRYSDLASIVHIAENAAAGGRSWDLGEPDGLEEGISAGPSMRPAYDRRPKMIVTTDTDWSIRHVFPTCSRIYKEVGDMPIPHPSVTSLVLTTTRILFPAPLFAIFHLPHLRRS